MYIGLFQLHPARNWHQRCQDPRDLFCRRDVVRLSSVCFPLPLFLTRIWQLTHGVSRRRPVYGLIFLYKFREESSPDREDCPPDVWFANQAWLSLLLSLSFFSSSNPSFLFKQHCFVDDIQCVCNSSHAQHCHE